ncbi:MAG: hypothetical protein ABW019_13330 [Chitinophagaceae bacterium]
MRKLLFIVTVCFLTANAAAQKTALEKAVDSSCKCLNEVKSRIKSSKDFDELAQNCILKASAIHFEAIAKEEGIDFEKLDDETGEKIGEKIGMKLALSCPAFLELFMQYGDVDDEDVIKGEVKGTVTYVEATDHVYVTVKDAAGKLTKVIWLDYFEGADEYKANPLLLKGKAVTISWVQAEIYSVKQKDFISIKRISKLAK